MFCGFKDSPYLCKLKRLRIPDFALTTGDNVMSSHSPGSRDCRMETHKLNLVQAERNEVRFNC